MTLFVPLFIYPHNLSEVIYLLFNPVAWLLGALIFLAYNLVWEAVTYIHRRRTKP